MFTGILPEQCISYLQDEKSPRISALLLKSFLLFFLYSFWLQPTFREKRLSDRSSSVLLLSQVLHLCNFQYSLTNPLKSLLVFLHLHIDTQLRKLRPSASCKNTKLANVSGKCSDHQTLSHLTYVSPLVTDWYFIFSNPDCSIIQTNN